MEKKDSHLMGLCWLAYMVSYLGKLSYNANITLIEQRFHILHAESGLVTTCFFFSYGIGQIVHGLLCKRYNKRWVLAGVLLFSAVCNTAIGFDIPFSAWKWLWLCNGATQSVLWSSMVDVLAQNLSTENLKRSVVVLSTTTPVGTLLAYGSGALFALVGDYRYSFFTAAAVLVVVAVLWWICYPRLTTDAAEAKQPAAIATLPTNGEHGRAVLVGYLVLFGLFSVITNLVKDGLGTWVPTILKETYGLTDSLSIILSLALPLIGIFSSMLVVALYRKLPNFRALSATIYLVSGLCICAVLLLLNSDLWWLVLLFFAVTSLLMHGTNSISTAMMPMYLRGSLPSGTLAGIMNGCAYVGSTVSAYGLGAIADLGGWNGVFVLLAALSAVPILLALLSAKWLRRTP